LVPAQRSHTQTQKERDKSANLANRDLLYHFLKQSFKVLLNPEGERLCYITSKSVKPYSHWHIETSLTLNNLTTTLKMRLLTPRYLNIIRCAKYTEISA
jgi:25S rRNA (uracil2634-N3)-methyltransferase